MQTSNRNKNSAFILTFLYPFVGLIYSLSNWRQSWAKNAFWMACVYMGAVFIYDPEGTILGVGADGGRYVLRLMDMYNNPDVSIGGIMSLYLKDPQVMDLYQQLLTFFISRFTDNGHVLFAFFAFVFGFFYSRNIWYVLEKLPNKRLGNLVVLVALLIMVCPISAINGVRMWTALHVFVYGFMPYLIERDKSRLVWALITPLIHFSFLYIVIFAIGFYLLPYRSKTNLSWILYFALAIYITSFLVNAVAVNSVGGILAEYSPESYEDKIEAYTNQDYADARREAASKNNWYVGASGVITHWIYGILTVVLLPSLRKNFKNVPGMIRLYTFALLLGSFANIMALIPSGGRFQLLSQMFTISLLLLTVMNVSNADSFRKVVNVAVLPLLIPLIFQIRQQIFDYYSITLLFGNFITVFFWENNVEIINYIKHLL